MGNWYANDVVNPSGGWTAKDMTSLPTTTAGFIKVFNGSVWDLKPVKYWNGTSWVTKPVKYWNGTSWI